MKRKILIGMIALVLPLGVNAASISCSGGGTVTQGNTFTVSFYGSHSGTAMWKVSNLYYNSSIVTNQSGFSTIAVDQQTLSASYTFKAANLGSTNIYLAGVDVADTSSTGNQLIGPGGTSSFCSVTVVAPAPADNSNRSNSNSNGSSSRSETNANLSSNNNLESLSIEGVKISPEFDRGTLEYSAEVANNVEKITVHAEAADSEASVSGWGERELEEGPNEINVVVTAENGSTKTYTIIVTRQEKDPIRVNIGGVEYTVVRKAPEKIDVPSGFKETTIKIKGEEVVAYKDAKNKITLVLLADKKGKTAFYLYDGTNYSKFIETSSSLNLALLNINGELDGFKKDTITINGEKVEVLVSKKNNNFIIVKAINLDTGKEGYYIYDKSNNSFIEYDENIYGPVLKDKGIKGLMTSIAGSNYSLFFALGILGVLLLLILTLVLSIKNKKLNKLLTRITTPVDKEKKKEEDKKEEKKETKEEIEEPVIEESKTIVTEDALSSETIELDEDEFEPLDDDIKPKPKKKKTNTKKKKK